MGIKFDILHRDGTQKVYESPAIAGQYLVFTSKGDDIVNNTVGNGSQFFIENPNGLDEVAVDVQFMEDIQVKDAYFFWENANWGDSISIEAILPANTLFPSLTNTGNINIIDGNITPVTSSMTPDETWTGSHMYFPIDVTLIKFVNEMMIHGTNIVGTILESKGVAYLPKMLKFKMVYKSTTKNPNIKLSALAEVYRNTTI